MTLQKTQFFQLPYFHCFLSDKVGLKKEETEEHFVTMLFVWIDFGKLSVLTRA